ncbi:hypothetical protein PI125_g6990 [Phytophthora idaei]|nr:hypothetical protein PI125_g6990 [Phytophthora idaei]KAG3173155.1 hypothetical protein PI126_g982 [Phytophthora idaei]
MLEYLASIPGTMEIRPQYNTTTFMLEVVGAGIGCDVKDYSVEYKNSELCRLNRERTLELAERMFLIPLYAIIFGTTFYQLSAASVAKISSHNNMDFIGVVNLMTVLEVRCVLL